MTEKGTSSDGGVTSTLTDIYKASKMSKLKPSFKVDKANPLTSNNIWVFPAMGTGAVGNYLQVKCLCRSHWHLSAPIGKN